jgi:hypothetical protein
VGYLFRIGLIGFVTTMTHPVTAPTFSSAPYDWHSQALDLSLMQINLLDLISRGREGTFAG